MLNIICVNSHAQKRIEILDLCQHYEVVNEKFLIIVSDLESKRYWKRELSEKKLEGSLFRAHDFWKFIFEKSYPDFKILNSNTLGLVIKSFCDESLLEQYQLSYIKFSRLKKYFEELFPLFSHPNSEEIMQAWFTENEIGQQVQWKNIYQFCKIIWNTLLLKKHIPESCLIHYILSSTNFEQFWKNTKILVDLGGHFKSIESEVIINLSLITDVTCFEPDIISQENYFWLNRPYEHLRTRKFKVEHSKHNIEDKLVSNEKYLRFQTPMGEIEYCIIKVNELLKNKKIDPIDIAISAPNIEYYWPMLEYNLQKKQIAYSKVKIINLIELSMCRKLLALLKGKYLFNIKFIDIEQAIFLNENSSEPTIKFSLFKDRLSNINTKSDLSRLPEVNILLDTYFELLSPEQKLLSASDYIGVNDFLDLLKKVFNRINSDEADLVTFIEENFIKFNMEQIQWTIPQWIESLDLFFQKQEKTVEHATVGVSILPISQLYSNNFKIIIIMGLNEGEVKADSSVVAGKDVLSLMHHTGHVLNHSDKNQNEFYLKWLQKSECDKYFLFSELDWKHKELTPSLFWTNGFNKFKELQNNLENELLHIDSEKLLNTKIKNLNQGSIEKSIGSIEINIKLSPSSLIRYLECPFKFYMERVLKQTEEQLLDLDLSNLTSGTLLHNVCEELIEDPFNGKSEITDEFLKSKITTIIDKNSSGFISGVQKSIFIEKIMSWAIRFLKNEENIRKQSPELKTIYKEKSFKTMIEGIEYSGKIDRIDYCSNSKERLFYVIDYKSSVTSISSYKSWIKNFDIQIFAYIYALEQGWVIGFNPNQDKVVGGSYYCLKTFTKKGFLLEGVSSQFIIEQNTRNIITEDDKNDLVKNFEDVLMSVVTNVKSKKFDPKPYDSKICKECNWRYVCPNPQLNL